VRASRVWWGFSAQLGWVAIDREFPGNEPGGASPLAIVCCNDWSVRVIPRPRAWPPSGFTFSRQYILRLSESERSGAERDLGMLQLEYRRREQELRGTLVKARHRNYAATTGRSYQGLRETRGVRRTPPCYKCNRRLDSDLHFACVTCDWIVCWGCGACGCGYGGT
jgi:hypothetical protein